MEITVCVGSSCHLKGSHKVIAQLKELIKTNNLEDKITLKAAFCMGRCTKGVSANLNGRCIDYLTAKNVEEFFYKEIRGGLDR